jgi:hypothetical protein
MVFIWAGMTAAPDSALCRLGYCEPAAATVESEPYNPYGWSDLAERRGAAGDVTGAREAFTRSVALGPNVPPVLIRAVNFEVEQGELRRALPLVRHILELTPAYDNILFRYLARYRVQAGNGNGLEMQQVLQEAIPDPGEGTGGPVAVRSPAGHASAPEGEQRPKGDAARGWVAHLIAEKDPEAGEAWRWLAGRGGVSSELRRQWVDYLVAVKRDFPAAVEAWKPVAGAGYPGSTRLANGRFEQEPGGGRMNWTLSPHPRVAVRRGEGLELLFDGKDNTAYANLTQQTFVPAGRWRFRAEAEARGLTTDQRPFFRIHDTFDAGRLDVVTPMAPEAMTVEFTSPAGGSWVTVILMRRPSEKFDSKIQGSLRLREVRIEPVRQG